jgi:hypothetical protein
VYLCKICFRFGRQLFSVYHSVGRQPDANLAATLVKYGCRLAACQSVFISQLTAIEMQILQK